MDNNTLFYRILVLVVIVIGMWWLNNYMMKKPEQFTGFSGGHMVSVIPVSVVPVNVSVQGEAYGLPVRWWESTDLCMVAVVMPTHGNLKKLHAFLGGQIKMVDFVCSTHTSYNEKGINEPCLKAYMSMQAAVDAYLKTMIKNHGGPFVDKNWND
jgi:hypothetical protein